VAGQTSAGPTAPTHARRSGVTVSPKLILAAVIVIAAIWFIVVNRDRIDIYLWVPKVTAPLWLVLLITFAGGLLAGLLLRRRRSGGTAR
jgi:uncharacterized integral membrane protein